MQNWDKNIRLQIKVSVLLSSRYDIIFNLYLNFNANVSRSIEKINEKLQIDYICKECLCANIRK